jgi:peroxiredoxin
MVDAVGLLLWPASPDNGAMEAEPLKAEPPKRKRFNNADSYNPTFRCRARMQSRRTLMGRVLIVVGLLWVIAQAASGADRLAEVEKLASEYKAAEKEFFDATMSETPTTAETIRRYEAWPGWRCIPRFVAFAEAKLDDEAALRCCQWIIERTRNVGNSDKRIFEADQKAWKILAVHHTQRLDLPVMCFQAAQYFGPAQEQFLRGLLERKDLSRENRGFAIVALGELLASEFEYCEEVNPSSPQDEFSEYLRRNTSPEWGKDLIRPNASKFKSESIQLFRDVLAKYADIPITISAPYFRAHNLGEKASMSLHALEHLTIGSEAPDIVGKDLHDQPLNLHDYRGKVVVLKFWFAGCGPCMAMIQHEKRLIETYKGRPFALLGVSADESREQALKTADEHKMDWSCWFDGKNGPIIRDWNVLGFPTVYVLDKGGLIVAKNPGDKELDSKIADLMQEKN